MKKILPLIVTLSLSLPAFAKDASSKEIVIPPIHGALTKNAQPSENTDPENDQETQEMFDENIRPDPKPDAIK